MKIENHNVDLWRNSFLWMRRSFENNPAPDTSGHQKKNPFLHASMACLSHSTDSSKPELCSLQQSAAPRFIKLYKTSLNFFNPKKRNPLLSAVNIGSYHFLTLP